MLEKLSEWALLVLVVTVVIIEAVSGIVLANVDERFDSQLVDVATLILVV